MVYVSNDEPVPTERKCDLKTSLPNSMTVVEHGKQSTIFSNFNIYVSFYSQEGISI